jgi:hypothetical protein
MTGRTAQPLSEIAANLTLRTINGVSVRFVESDQRDVDALLLSPWPESVFAYEAIWSRLVETTHVVAIDLPGFGRSEGTDALMTPRAMGEFIVRAADAFGLEKPHAVGPDIGTSAALFAAGLTPRALPEPRRRYRRRGRSDSTRRSAARMGIRTGPRAVSADRWTRERRACARDARALRDHRCRSPRLPRFVRGQSIQTRSATCSRTRRSLKHCKPCCRTYRHPCKLSRAAETQLYHSSTRNTSTNGCRTASFTLSTPAISFGRTPPTNTQRS